ncbi:MAG TPA: helix-hairpin-helix domain-containing protein [Thermoanaerobaculia bacterium]|jgi:competence protein ComEA|nr:helix-hairpin-helix domain-containing protein [Thermoanaerobaculia bacterium]
MSSQRRFLSTILFLGLLASSLPTLPAAAAAVAEGKRVVNVNTADPAKLSLLPRVGPAVAERIVDYRKENGPFKSAEDLMQVRGIGEKTFALIKPYVALSGETSLTEKVSGSGSRTKSKSKGPRH